MSNENSFDFTRWYDLSLKLLAFRPRSVKEISDYLQRKKVPPFLTTQVISQLTERKLLNDRVFAEWFVENRVTFRPRSTRVLQAELLQKGVSRELITEVLRTQFDADVEFAGALKTAQKKLRHLRHPDDQVKWLKLSRFLGQKGYDYALIGKVLTTLKANRAFDAKD